MFYGCSSLTSLKLEFFDTTKIKSNGLQNAFDKCDNLVLSLNGSLFNLIILKCRIVSLSKKTIFLIISMIATRDLKSASRKI